MAGLSIKGVESDHHITGAFERSRRHPHIHATAVHDHVGLELLFEACKSYILVCAEENKKRRRCWDPGGHFRNYWVGMCRWDPGTLDLYQS